MQIQALLLCPVCPHISEHVWSLLGKVYCVQNNVLLDKIFTNPLQLPSLYGKNIL